MLSNKTLLLLDILALSILVLDILSSQGSSTLITLQNHDDMQSKSYTQSVDWHLELALFPSTQHNIAYSTHGRSKLI